MLAHPDRAPLVRLAATLPQGSPERRTILAAITKLAAVADDTLARADLVSGALNGNQKEQRGPVFEAMQSGVGDFFAEWNNWVKVKVPEYEVKDLKTLREADLSEDDEAELKAFDSRMKGYKAIAPKLLDLLGQIGESEEDAYEVLTNRRDYKLREAVMAGAAKGIHGMVQTLDSGRRQVTDIGRGGISTPGSMGQDAEDLAQVMLVGGVKMPGMVFDMRMSDKTDIGGGVSIRGKFKDRKKPWAPAGSSIYTIAGAARGPLIKPGKNYARTVAMNAAVDWKRSVHVELEYILTSADEGDVDTQAINMGGKASLEMLLGAELIDGVSVSRQMTLAKYYLKKISGKMDQHLSAGTAKAAWQAVVEMIGDGKNPWKKGGSAWSIDVPMVIKFLEDSREGQRIVEQNGNPTVDKKTLQARWKDAVKAIQRTMSQLSDDDLLSSLHLTLEGMVDDIPEYIQRIRRDKDLAQTYLSDLRKRASEEKTAMRTITASERTAMIRLAALLPVGSSERRALIAGCEKLKVPAMRENCEKSKKDGVQPGKGKSKAKSDDKKKDDGKMPAELLEKFEAKDKKAAGAVSKAQALGRSADKRKVGDFFRDKELQKLLTPMVEADDLDEYGKTLEAYVNARQRQMHQDAEKDLRAMGIDMPHWKKAGEVPDALKKHQFTGKDGDNPPPADADGDGKTNEPKPFKGKTAMEHATPVKSKKAEHHEESKEKYPWDECIKQQTEAYSAEAAPKICGKIRAESQGRAANTRSALVRMAASMPKGSEERKTLIRMAAGA